MDGALPLHSRPRPASGVELRRQQAVLPRHAVPRLLGVAQPLDPRLPPDDHVPADGVVRWFLLVGAEAHLPQRAAALGERFGDRVCPSGQEPHVVVGALQVRVRVGHLESPVAGSAGVQVLRQQQRRDARLRQPRARVGAGRVVDDHEVVRHRHRVEVAVHRLLQERQPVVRHDDGQELHENIAYTIHGTRTPHR